MAQLVGDLVTIAADTRFQNRVKYCLRMAAINVMAEAPSTGQHSQRVAFARTVVSGGGPSALDVAISVLTNSTIAAEANIATTPDFAIPDGDLQFTVNSLFNALAGVAL